MYPIMEAIQQILLARGNVDGDAFQLWLDAHFEGESFAAYEAIVVPVVNEIEDQILAVIGEDR